MLENPRRGRQAKNFTENVPKILDLKSSSEQIFSDNWRWVPWFRVATTGFPKKWRLAENVHTDDVGSASDWMKQILTNQKYYPDPGSDA